MTHSTRTLCAIAAAWLIGAMPALAANSVVVLEQGQRTTLLRLSVDDPKLEEVNTPAGRFMRFSQREASQGGGEVGTDAQGMAELPVLGFPLALPLDLRDSIVEVIPEGPAKQLQALIFPVQPMEIARKQEPELMPFVFDRDAYLKGFRLPGQALDRTPIFKGDANIESFKFSPFGYDPDKALLTYHNSYLVRVFHAAGACFTIDHLADQRTARSYDAIDRYFQRQPLSVLPFAVNNGWAQANTCPPVIVPNPFGVRYLIVSHPNFLAAANTLRNHKQLQGISTLVVSTQTISGGPAFASANQIRNWIANYYNTHVIKPKWLALMGDAEFVPTHYDQINIWDSARNAGDIWYGQFAGGPTTIPPFGVGRFPVDTLAQANTMVSKVMAFENAPPPGSVFGQDFYSRLTFASYFQGSGTTDERWFAEVSEIVRNHAVSLNYSPRRIYRASNASNPLNYRGGGAIPLALRKPGFAWNGSAADIVNAVNNGTALLYHRDHGWWDGWGDPSFGIGNLGAISVTNNQFPVVFSINCASGLFDNETVDLAANIVGGGYGPGVGSVYWAENFVRKADGALAVIGDTRSSSTIDNGHLTLGLFDAVFPGLVPGYGGGVAITRLGDMLNHARAFIAAVDSGATPNRHPFDVGGVRPGLVNLRQELNIYNLFGDPTVKLRVRPPYKFSIGILKQLLNVIQIQIPIPEPPCLSCPRPELITAVAIDPVSGRLLGRTLIDDNGNGAIDVGNFRGNVWVRVASPDGATTQAAVNETDEDGDAVPDSRDNCTKVSNRNQLDSDGDGFGNACDGDLNNDNVVNALDLALFRNKFGTRGEGAADLNGDGVVNAIDLALFRRLFAGTPGPSAWHVGGGN